MLSNLNDKIHNLIKANKSERTISAYRPRTVGRSQKMKAFFWTNAFFIGFLMVIVD